MLLPSLRSVLLPPYRVARRILAPGLRSSQYDYEDELCLAVTPQTRWLDVGCGHQVLPKWRLALERELTARAAHVSGVDPDREAITKHRTIKDIHVGTLEALPFQAGSYNLITANMVLEHLSDPGRALKEIFRVLAPSGIFLFHTPNANGYFVRVIKQIPEGIKRPAARLLEGRAGEDVYPAHYRCNSERDILNLAAASGFEVSFIRHVSTNAVFGSLLPLAIPELLWIRATMQDQRKRLRTDIIAALRKPGTA